MRNLKIKPWKQKPGQEVSVMKKISPELIRKNLSKLLAKMGKSTEDINPDNLRIEYDHDDSVVIRDLPDDVAVAFALCWNKKFIKTSTPFHAGFEKLPEQEFSVSYPTALKPIGEAIKETLRDLQRKGSPIHSIREAPDTFDPRKNRVIAAFREANEHRAESFLARLKFHVWRKVGPGLEFTV